MEFIRKQTKKLMSSLARWLDKTSNGKITPNMVSIASLVLHLLIFIAIVAEQNILAAVMIVVFGLMDSLDGALAREQGVESKAGMLLDATADRVKEAIIFMALAYRFALDYDPKAVLATVAAVTGSFAVSYIKAKGETALKGSHLTAQEINRVFQSGLMRYEIRMAVLVIGLIFSTILVPLIWVLAVASWATALYRFINISKKIS